MQSNVKAITSGPKNHYFGYYDKRQFDQSGRFALGLACDIFDRMQTPDDEAELGMIDLLDNDKWIPLGRTKSWSWQFGCLAQWMPAGNDTIIYNDRRDNRFVAVLLNTATRAEQVIPHPVFDIRPDGRTALTVDFSRLARVRPETGFPCADDRPAPPQAPDHDGLFCLDLATGNRTLLASLAEMAKKNPAPSMSGATHYITHPLWNEDGSRFLFWHRWKRDDAIHCPSYSRLYTANADGSGMKFLIEGNSHTTWRGDGQVLAWAETADMGSHYFLCDENSATRQIIGKDTLTDNGHFTFFPGAKWLLTDTPMDKNRERAVLLYHWETGKCFEAARFVSHPSLNKGELRCDLHPRKHPDGRRICVDSSHEGARQMYIIDAGQIIDSKL